MRWIYNKTINILWKYSSLGEALFWVLLELVHRWTQHFTKIHHEKRKIEQICIWKPMTTGFIL